MRKYWKFVFAIMLVASGALFTFVFGDVSSFLQGDIVGKSQAILPGVTSDVTQFDKEWIDRIEKVGAATAYHDFLIAYATATTEVQHTNAHLFGNVLYQADGIDGIKVCDSQFEAGCYHEFLGRAIQDDGTEIVVRLNEKCLETAEPDWCQHGIGHGVVGYVGYEYDSLVNALEICDTLRVQSRIGGCFGGVFMEYNSKLLANANGGVGGGVRQFDETTGFNFPCDRIETPFRDACYFRQPQWWMTSIFSNQWGDKIGRLNMFKKMGELCGKVEEGTQQDYCFKGIGLYGVSVVSGNIEEMILVCKSMPSNRDIECRAMAVNSPYFNLLPQETPQSMCDGLSSIDHRRCLEISKTQL